MLVETAPWLMTTVCLLKTVFHRIRHHFQARLAYVVAPLNAVLGLNRRVKLNVDPQDRLYHFTQFAL